MLMGSDQSKAYWQPDEDAPNCNLCGTAFSFLTRRHHCRNCGFVFCKKCSGHKCPITMRGIQEAVRVCDSCFAALVASTRGFSAPPLRGAGVPGLEPGHGAPDRRLTTRDTNSAPATAHSFAGGAGVDSSAGIAAAAKGDERESQSRGAENPTPTEAEAGTARPPDAAAAGEETQPEVEAEEPVNEAFQDAYGAAGTANGSSQASAPTQQTMHQQQAAKFNANLSPEQMEREILARQWAAVRQEAQFVDILVQRAEKVEPTSMVEYSRETEAVTLQPEVPVQVLGTTVLPLPQPVENSARYLMEPVKLWTKNNSKQLFALEAAATALAPQLQPPLRPESIRRACPTQFAES